MIWLILVALYLIIGVGLWLYYVINDAWGSLLLIPAVAILVILGYPYLIIRNWFVK